MKCVVCEKFSFHIICPSCLEEIPLSFSVRVINNAVRVYSFYKYSDVSYLLQSKYYCIGSRILKILSRKAALGFKDKFVAPNVDKIYAVGLDDYPYSIYSHVGVILREFRSYFTPIYGELKARNKVTYAGQNLEFRLNNPRNFAYDSGAKNLVLIDDIITTGTSLNEAVRVVESQGANVIFCIALCDARE